MSRYGLEQESLVLDVDTGSEVGRVLGGRGRVE